MNLPSNCLKITSGKSSSGLVFRFGSFVFMFFAVLGCQRIDCTVKNPPNPPVINSFVDPHQLGTRVRRVVIFPFENQTRFADSSRVFQRQLAGHLRTSGLFEVVDVAPWYDLPCSFENISRGQYPLSLLAEIHRRFNADAVVFGSIQNQSPYWPISLGLTLHMIDTRDATVVASVDGNWSVADEQVSQDFKYYLSTISGHPAGQDPRILQSSPTFFSDYVARLIVNSMR